jgi:hypothetical protein
MIHHMMFFIFSCRRDRRRRGIEDYVFDIIVSPP